MTEKIKVVDAICGSGKTSWAIQEMNANKDKKYMYITPFLTEIDRVIAKTDRDFKQPVNKGDTKMSSFENLISYGGNIVSTHALFQDIDFNKRSKLSRGKYTLVLDEVMDVIERVPKIKSGDIEILLNEGIITVDDEKYVKWIKDYKNTQYDNLKAMTESRSVILVNDHLMMWNFPIEIFDCFEEVYILTYKFDGQIMSHYYDYHNVKYTKYSVKYINDRYQIIDYSKENEIEYIKQYKKLINIYESNNKTSEKDLNAIANRYNALSVTWLKNADKERRKELKDNIYNYFTNRINGEAYYNMWTTFKDYKKFLKGKGYTECKLVNEKGKLLLDKNDKQIKQECFVPFNKRAINEYKFKKNLAYICNVFIHPDIEKFFSLKGIEYNKDEYALSELVQWLFRSAIREYQPINLYIPSKRMRILLINWLYEK